jgi:hypothetical protein
MPLSIRLPSFATRYHSLASAPPAATDIYTTDNTSTSQGKLLSDNFVSLYPATNAFAVVLVER